MKKGTIVNRYKTHDGCVNMRTNGGKKMEILKVILKMLGMGCLIVGEAIVLVILIACIAEVVKALIRKK